MRLALSGVLVKIHFMVSFKRIHSFIGFDVFATHSGTLAWKIPWDRGAW